MPDAVTPAVRFPLQFTIEYRHSYAREHDNGVLKNISLSGAFIESHHHRFQPSDKIKVTFKVGGRSRQIPATIVWTHPSGAGIKFGHGNNQDKQIVDDLIYYVENQRNTRRNVLNTIFDQVIDEEDDGTAA